VLGVLHRRALSWITLPLIAVLVAAGAYGGALLTKGQSVQTNQVGILHLLPGSDLAYQETYTGVLTPTRGDYTVGLGAPMLVSPISSYFGGGAPNRSDVQVGLLDGSVGLPGMTGFSLRGFATEGMLAGPPKFTGHLQEVNGRLTGTVENLSRLTFTDAVVIAGDGYQKLGTLAPGDSLAFSITPKPVTFNGPPGVLSIYPNSYFGGGPQNGAPTAAQRDGQTKTQILSLLVGAGFKGGSTSTAPILIAWSDQTFQPVTVNGGHPRSKALTALVVPLPIEEVGAGTLPPNVVIGRIVDVDGDSQQGPPGVLVLQKGSVTLEFTPPLTPGTRLNGVNLITFNPYKGGISGTTGTRGEAWDWTQATWVDVGFQDGGTTPLPDAVVNPTTGAVRLRVTAGAEPYMAVPISLTGTVR
jgi:hypothetical protein